jgi:hypothetical protein
MSSEAENLQTVRRYFEAIERDAGFEEVAKFLTPDIVQIEYPNRFVANGAQHAAPLRIGPPALTSPDPSREARSSSRAGPPSGCRSGR